MIKKKNFNLKCGSRLLDLQTPAVMGILNCTPDSFYAESRNSTETQIVQRAEQILAEGAAIIDIGGYSTRPTADFVSEEDEMQRVRFACQTVKKHFPDAILSVDTFRAKVAEIACGDFGVEIINDISGGTLDEKMFEIVSKQKAAYILMHTRGTPQTMQTLTNYDDIVAEILDFFQKRINILHSAGVNDVIIDLGFGFAKTLEQNYLLLKNMLIFQTLAVPMLVGVSRKSMIQKALNVTAENALNGTTAANMIALMNGANILRIHDVKEAVEAIKIFQLTMNNA